MTDGTKIAKSDLVFDCVTIKALIDGLRREQAHVLDFKRPERHMLTCTGGENKFHGPSGFDRYPQRLPVSNAWC